MKELVEVIAKALVENPDEVVVTESVKDDETVIELSVAPADMGKVIGKQGRIAKAIRSVVKAASSKEDKSYCRDSVIQTKLKSRLPEKGVRLFYINHRKFKRMPTQPQPARECKARSISYRRIIEWLII